MLSGVQQNQDSTLGSLLKGGCRQADDFREAQSVRGRLKSHANLKRSEISREIQKFQGSTECLRERSVESHVKEQDPGEGARPVGEGQTFLVYAGEQASPGEQASRGNRTLH